MSSPLQLSIARVRSGEGSPIFGTAFLISPRHVMTCAHVVNAAGKATWNSKEPPNAQLRIEFPFAANVTATTASVIEWRPPDDKPAADIAVLQLDKDIGVACYRTALAQPEPGQRFWTKGFPAGQIGGMEAAGKLGTRVEFGRMLAQGEGQEGFFIEAGFSGAPLVDPQTDAVLGMAVEATRDGTRRTAFVFPADQLELAWPPLARPYKGLAAFQESDARFFQGRERYVDELVGKLDRLPLVAVLGRSGAGKSSLVRAGLIPRLRAQGDWHVLVFRPGSPTDNPLRNFAAALLDVFAGPASPTAEAMNRHNMADEFPGRLYDEPNEVIVRLRTLAEARSRLEPLRILLVVDPFEELFTTVRDPSEADPSSICAFVLCVACALRLARTWAACSALCSDHPRRLHGSST